MTAFRLNSRHWRHGIAVARVVLGAAVRPLGRSRIAEPPGTPAPANSDLAPRLRRLGLLGIVVLILVVVTGTLARDVERSRDRQSWVFHTYEVINQTRGLLVALEQAESAQRGYLITAEDHQLDFYETAVARMSAARQQLRRLTADHATQQKRLDAADSRIEERMAQLDVLRNQAPGDPKRLRDLHAEGVRRGRLLMNLVRADLESIEAEERQLLGSRIAEAENHSQRIHFALVLGSSSLLLLLVLAGAIIERDNRIREADRRLIRENEQRLHVALTASEGAVWEWDAGTRAGYWSEELWRLCGLPPRGSRPDYRLLGQAVHPDDRKHTAAEVRRALREGAEINLEFRVVHPDGAERWLMARAQPMRDTAGRVARYVGTFIDITGRKRTEEALRASEDRFHTLADAIPQLCWRADAGGAVVWYNQRWYTYTGTAPDALDDGVWQAVQHPSLLPEVIRCWTAAIQSGEPTEMVQLLRRHDGVFHPFLTRVVPLMDSEGKPVCWFGTSTDITKQQEVERALRESQDRLAFALEASHIGHWELNLETGRVVRSPGHDRIFGFPEPLPEWTNETFMARILPEDRPFVAQSLREAVEAKGSSNIECRMVRPDGTQRWIWVSGQYCAGDPADPPRMSGVVQDITERKLAEERVRQLNGELEQRVNQRTAELQASNRELEAFAYSVSHDLRAPLRGIDGWSLALAEDYASRLDARGMKYLSQVRWEAQRMGILIDDLLQLSRVTRSEMQTQAVDLSALAATVADGLRRSQPARQLEFRISGGLKAPGDARFLEIALRNLLDNAVKFTGRQPWARIEFGLVEQNGETAFFVRDNGDGFDMAYAGGLFTAFQRLHKPSEFPGSGIGLATVQRIIARHHGRVWAEAEPGRGATFYFTIGLTHDEYQHQDDPAGGGQPERCRAHRARA